MRVQRSLVVVSMLLGAAALEAGPEPDVDDTHRFDITARSRVAVRVYNQVTDLSSDDQRVALDVATDVFTAASVRVGWTRCDPGGCLTPPGDSLRVRIATSPDGKTDSRVLGQALIDRQTQSGVLATVFIDRTRRLASDLGIDYRIVLGRAIAHELGHLLIGTSAHGSGLMREIWSYEELLGTRRNDWVLDPFDAAVIRERLSRPRGRSS
jgi:hypothetical protein